MKYIKPTLLVLFLLAFLLTAVSMHRGGGDKPGTSTPAKAEQTAQLSATDSGDVTEAPTESARTTMKWTPTINGPSRTDRQVLRRHR